MTSTQLRIGLLASIPAVVLACPALFAQDIEKEGHRPQEAIEKQKTAAQAAQEAQERKPAEGGGPVTYDQILKNPDDVELNYRYAKQQVEQGDLKGASATLERILMVDPKLPRVRLLYAVVLFRLDDLAESEQELNALKGLPMSEELKKEIDLYLGEIARRRRMTHLAARVGVGFQYDVNRNAAPASGQRLVFDTPVTLVTGTRQDDTSMLYTGSLRASRDLGTQAGHELFASLNYYRAEQTVVRFLNLQAYSAEAGGVYRTPVGNFTPSALFDHIRLHEQTYLRNRGGQVTWDRQLSRSLGLFALGRYTYNDFSPTSDVPSATDRNGRQIDGGVGASFVLTPAHRLQLTLIHTDKDAAQGFDAYKRQTARAQELALLGRGMFLLTALTVNVDDYKSPQVTVSSNKRHDSSYRASATLGLPLDLFYAPLSDFLWTLNYEYFQSISNIQDFLYRNNTIGTMLTYKWDY